MAPRKAKTTAAPTVTTSPRRTRSATAGKRVVPPPAKAPTKKQRVAKEKKKDKEKEKEKKEGTFVEASVPSENAIVIEACKQCSSFKIRANLVKDGLESAVSGIDVTINPDKPRRGCFEVRKASGSDPPFISLLDMKRPFKPMKDLDMDQLVQEIVEKIK